MVPGMIPRIPPPSMLRIVTSCPYEGGRQETLLSDENSIFFIISKLFFSNLKTKLMVLSVRVLSSRSFFKTEMVINVMKLLERPTVTNKHNPYIQKKQMYMLYQHASHQCWTFCVNLLGGFSIWMSCPSLSQAHKLHLWLLYTCHVKHILLY